MFWYKNDAFIKNRNSGVIIRNIEKYIKRSDAKRLQRTFGKLRIDRL